MQHLGRVPLPEHVLALLRFLATQMLDHSLKEGIFPTKMTIEGHNGNTSLSSNHLHGRIGISMPQEQLFCRRFNGFLFALKQTSFRVIFRPRSHATSPSFVKRLYLFCLLRNRRYERFYSSTFPLP